MSAIVKPNGNVFVLDSTKAASFFKQDNSKAKKIMKKFADNKKGCIVGNKNK